MPRRPDDGFPEIGQGDWQGLHRDEIGARYGAELAAWRRTPLDGLGAGRRVAPRGPGTGPAGARGDPRDASPTAGRPARSTARRSPGYGEPPAAHPWSVVVGHDGVFKIALLTLFGLSLERYWMWSMDLCAITIVEFRAGRPVLRAHNLTAHLGAAGRRDGRGGGTRKAAAEERERSGAQ